MSKTFCPLPWNHLATHPQGSISLCCESDMRNRISDSFNVDFEKSDREDGRIFQSLQSTKYDFDKIINSDSFKEVRRQMLNDEIPPACSKCFEFEKVGIQSKRQYDSNRLALNEHDARLTTKEDGSIANPKYEFIELRLGNHCNLACRSCNLWSSTRWVEDWDKVYDEDAVYNKDDYVWPLDTEFWDKLGAIDTSNLKNIYINGGEPLLIDKHAKFLEKLIEDGVAKNICLNYSTNCTVKPTLYEKLWPNFKLVEIALSIDDLYHRQEFIRYGSNWEKVLDTFDYFMEYNNQHKNVGIGICQTVGIYNIYNLYDFEVFFTERVGFVLPMELNFIEQPDWLCAKNLKKSFKEVILQKNYGMRKYKMLESFLSLDGDETKMNKFFEKTKILDDLRGESFRHAFPELWNYLHQD